MRSSSARLFRKGLYAALGALVLLIIGSAARADTIGTWNFQCITGGGNCSLSSQFQVVVTGGDGHAVFTIHNEGPVDSSIHTVFWDDNSGVLDLSVPPTIVENSTGVSFMLDANPGNLPGGQNLTIAFTSDVSESRNGANSNGINPGEVLGVRFDVNSPPGINSLADAMNNGDLRLGLHGQALGSLVTVGNINSGTSGDDPLTTPEPASLLLLGTGIGVMGLIAYKKRNRK